MKINVTYDASAAGAPAGFTGAVDAAVAYYESNFDAPVTINITIGWGTAAGATIPDGAVGATYAPSLYFNYEEVRNAYWANARTSDTLTAAMNLPSTDPTNGGAFAMTSAQAKALGLIPGRDTESDGIIVMDPTSTYTFDPNNRLVASKIDAIGVLEHEIGHVLGRTSVLGEPLPGGSTLYGALDLFRYSAPGVRAPALGTAYFSIDGQNLLLPFNDPTNGGTESDWSISLTGDVFQAFVDEGELLQFSPTDKTMLDVFGYHPYQAKPVTSGPANAAISLIDTNGATVPFTQTILSVPFQKDLHKYELQQQLGPLTNNGAIVVTSATDDVAAFYVDAYAPLALSDTFTNSSTGSILVDTAASDAASFAFYYQTFAPRIVNAGLVQSVSQGTAFGILSWSPSDMLTNTASGILRVWGEEEAIGVLYHSEGAIHNSGLIEVISKHFAVGVAGVTEFVNSGTIKATSLQGDSPSVAVDIYERSPDSPGLFTNSGTIIADYAFYVDPDSTSPPFKPNVKIVNSGKIIGDIVLGNGVNQIQNTGIIGGDIIFGDTQATYDGANGHLYGYIYLGHAVNVVTLGGDGDTVYGGGGSDTITGGAGDDTFMITRGTNQLNGGGGYNTLSLEAAAVGYTLDLGAGTAVGAGATSTIANIQRVVGSSFADTLKAGNAGVFFMAGGGADTLIGGAGDDTLVAGSDGDSLTGGGGNDSFIYTAGDEQVVINDFRASGDTDVLNVFGYGSAVSTMQQGADTLITLTGSDKILLKNVLASSLTGGAVVYNSAVYMPPLTSPPLAVFGTTPIFLDYALTVDAAEQIVMDFGSQSGMHNGVTTGKFATGKNVSNVFDNFGSALFTANGGTLHGIDGDTIIVGSSFINEANAHFSVSNTNGDAGGVYAFFPTMRNAGSISVTASHATQRVDGIHSDHTERIDFTNTASGTITVQSDTSSAGVWSNGGGYVRNDGSIDVSGVGTAYGILEYNFDSGRSGVGPALINNGTIQVGGAFGATTYGIALGGRDLAYSFPPVEVINTGIITAQVAVTSVDTGSSDHASTSILLRNTGTINGDIVLYGSKSQIINAGGAINGNILLRDDWFSPGLRSSLGTIGGDTVDLRGGTFHGNITVSAGQAGNVVDHYDLFVGGATTTIKFTGGQSQMTATVRASQAGHTTVEYDMASSGASWAQQSDGSWLVSAGNRGTQTLFNVETLKFNNTTVTLPFSYTWSGYSGDFTGDHKTDLLWQKSDGSTQLWQSESHGKVASNTTSILLDLDTTEVLGVADYNGDGKADLLLRNLLSGTVSDQLMNGAAAGASKNLGVMDSSWSVKGSGDTGGDGKADILWQKSDGTVVIWHMNASGTIGSTANLGVVDMATWSLSNLADYNGDGKADVLLRNANGAIYNWLMNGGSVAGFNSLGTMDSSWSVKGTGDFGGDGRSDILWQKSDGTIVIWQMNSAGGLASSTSLGVLNPAVWSIPGVGDYNGDGKADILLRNDSDTIANWLMNGANIIGSNGLGAIASPAIAPPPPTPNDFGGDGRADLLWQDADGTGVLWQMSSAGAISSNTSLGVVSASFIGIGDYNGDGKADILLRDANGAVTSWLMNGATVIGTNNLSTMSNAWSVKGSGDFNGDGITDIFWQKSDGTAMVWQLTSSGTLAASPVLGVLPDWSLSTGGDFNGDGKADILLRNANGTVANWLMNGTSIAGSNTLGTMDSSWSVKGLGDFGGDGRSDILWGKSDGTVVIWQLNSAGAVASTTNLGTLPDWALANVADYNGDGKADILLRNNNGTVANWLMDGGNIVGSNNLGTMAASMIVIPGTRHPPTANDFGGDGGADLLWHKADGTVVLWQINASGGLSAAATVNTGLSLSVTSLVAVGDYNGDGKADVLVQNANGTVVAWLMNGTTIASTKTQSGTMDSSWTVRGSGDFNGDGRIDILWQQFDGSTAFWLMDGTGFNSSTTTTIFNTQFASVGDYNGDGKADILTRDFNGAVNVWLSDWDQQTGYKKIASNLLGSMDSSWSVKGSGDFNGDGRIDILWQKIDGTVVIWQMNSAGQIASSTNLGAFDPATWSFSVGGDYNGDGRADILLRNTNGTVYNWLMNGGAIIGSNNLGVMASSALAVPSPYVMPVLIVFKPNDFGGDGRADQLWHKADGTVVLWQTNTAGGQSSETTVTSVSPAASSLVSVGDYNGDGKADVLVQNANGTVNVWLMNGATIANTVSQAGTMDSSWKVRGSGDFNGDGRTDILWQKLDGSVTFWFMDGTGQNSSTATTTVSTQFVSVGDYNGDGKADILTRDGNGAVNDWLMDGSTKTASNSLGTMDSSWSVKGSGDFGGDGKADILWQKIDGTVVIWQMNAGGAIASVSNLGVVDPFTWSISVGGDYNGDGKADILLRNANGTVYNWLMNGGSIIGSNGPSAMASSALAVPSSYVMPTPGVFKPNDFGGDGRADQMWQKADGSLVLWQTSASGGLGSATTVTTVPTTASVVGVGDYNSDGKADVLVRAANGTLGLWLMNGATVAATIDLGELSLFWAYRGSGDFDGDGRNDILWQNSDGRARIWQLNGAGQIAGTNTFTLGPSNGSFLGTGDYNGDGKTDILTRDASGVVSTWLTGDWDPNKGYNRAVSAILGTMDGSWSVKGSGDFSGDGISDILWQKSDGTLVIWQMNSIGHIASSTNLGTFDPAAWAISAGGDYNGDGKADILLRKSDGTVYNWLMNGASIVGSNSMGAMASSATAVPTLLPDGPRAVFSDFDIDGYSDILWQKSDGTVTIWRMNSAGAIGSTASLSNVNPALTTIGGIGDFTGNGPADILLHNSNTSVTVWGMSGSTISNTINGGSIGNGFSVIGAADFNGDDRVDIVWDDPNSLIATLWVISPISGVTPLSITKSGATILGVMDFNADRLPELLVRNPDGTISDWLMSLNNVSVSNTLGTMDSSWSVKGLGDFGGDGRTDILWQKTDGTAVIWQSGGGSVASSTTLGTFSDWSFVGVGDYNGDGKSDILLRNNVNGTVANWLMNGASIIGSNTLGTMNSSWTAITR